MNINELYALKGQLVTELEISQDKLQQVNQEIIKIINSSVKASQSNGVAPEMLDTEDAKDGSPL
jgi:hypothetical protein